MEWICENQWNVLVMFAMNWLEKPIDTISIGYILPTFLKYWIDVCILQCLTGINGELTDGFTLNYFSVCMYLVDDFFFHFIIDRCVSNAKFVFTFSRKILKNRLIKVSLWCSCCPLGAVKAIPDLIKCSKKPDQHLLSVVQEELNSTNNFVLFNRIIKIWLRKLRTH